MQSEANEVIAEEIMEFDVLIIGAGPAGLSAAIRIKQQCTEINKDLSVCVLEKGSEVGAHILSGAVLEPRALNELLPNWKELGAPITAAATEDQFLWLTEKKAYRLPTPTPMHNKGNYIISLGNLCRWLAEQAEQMGVDIYPGFSASECVFDDSNRLIGIKTGAMGVEKEGSHGPNYQAGMQINGKHIILAEGCRGSLTKKLIHHYELDKDSDPQTYGIGIKELWKVDPSVHQAGKVIHTIGWPLDNKTYGGSFLYHMDDYKVAVGFVIGLDYENPYLNPYKAFQQFKTHPAIKKYFENGERISYGARAISEGGLQSLPKLGFPGGLLIGDAAGFLNVPKIKGTHCAMKSGMMAADAIVQSFDSNDTIDYTEQFKQSWLHDELYRVRNIRPSFHKGLLHGLSYSAFDTYLLRGKAPWTMKNHANHLSLKPAKECSAIDYPKPDGKVSFDLMSSVYLSSTNHEENQPCHLQLKTPELAISINHALYDSPEQRYCPAGVYEIVMEDGNPRLQINAQNCVHCKTCDIKDPEQNINWATPEGGGGPNYPDM